MIIIKRSKPVEVGPVENDDRPFQKRVFSWLVAMLQSEAIAKIRRRAVLRFVEEAIELAQALAIAEHDVNEVARKVYHKPPGKVAQEFGGVYTTLAALAECVNEDLDEIGEKALADCWARIAIIREKEKVK